MMTKKHVFTIILLCVAGVQSALAQVPNLPNKQKGSLPAPANIKIDGKADEWNNQLQAFNKATEVYYTIANDNNNLYLVIQAKYRDITDKIMRGGITFTINHSDSKGDKNAVSVTYPVIRDAAMSEVANMVARKFNQLKGDDPASLTLTDLNTLYQSRAKQINISGISQVTDPDISIYNELGIKAAACFDGKITYTYELAIPLKYLNLPASAAFAYHLEINEPADFKTPRPAGGSPGPPPPPMLTSSIAETDFWGEYHLAGK